MGSSTYAKNVPIRNRNPFMMNQFPGRDKSEPLPSNQILTRMNLDECFGNFSELSEFSVQVRIIPVGVDDMSSRGEPGAPTGLLDASVRFRPADPEDSAFLASAILMASRSHLPRGFWDLVVPDSEEDRLDFLELLTLMDARSFCHFSNFLVADGVDGPAAALSGYDPGEPGLLAPGHVIAAAYEEFGWSDADLAEAYRRLEPYQTAMPQERKGIWTVEWVWTVPAQRRHGLVNELLQRVLEKGRHAGFRQAQVTTYIGNAAASLLYSKAAFRVSEERRHPDFERLMGAPGLVRYERVL